LFDSYRWDSESGFYQVRYRYLHPSLGRWTRRDPIGEVGGSNLYEYVKNKSIGKNDPMGLETSSSHGHLHVSDNRHDNYIVYQISCPAGYEVTDITVDYHQSKMLHQMYLWALANYPFIIGSETEGMFDEETLEGLEEIGGSRDFGNVKSYGASNCKGKPVEVKVYMRTRLVAPAKKFGIWRELFDTPDPTVMLQIYENNTTIKYKCKKCPDSCKKPGNK
jgi:RHS repeat-associated protein